VHLGAARRRDVAALPLLAQCGSPAPAKDALTDWLAPFSWRSAARARATVSATKFLVATATANAPVFASKATIDHVTDFLPAAS
jgi:hypothetical protein